MAEKRRVDETADANPDPITGEPGAHPVGVGIGAAAGGAAAGALGGAAAGATRAASRGPGQATSTTRAPGQARTPRSRRADRGPGRLLARAPVFTLPRGGPPCSNDHPRDAQAGAPGGGPSFFMSPSP